MITLIYDSTYTVDTVKTLSELFTLVGDIDLDDELLHCVVGGLECSLFDLAIAGIFLSDNPDEWMTERAMCRIPFIDLTDDENGLIMLIVDELGGNTEQWYLPGEGLIRL
jgi:hypothetical protein